MIYFRRRETEEEKNSDVLRSDVCRGQVKLLHSEVLLRKDLEGRALKDGIPSTPHGVPAPL